MAILMLENLISKYKDGRKDKKQVVYKLCVADKYIIVKGNTLCGSLMIIDATFKQFKNKTPIKEDDLRVLEHTKRFALHPYRHLYNYYLYHRNDRLRFSVNIIARVSSKISQYDLLKREQMELDKARYDKNCLNNSLEAYIPVFNPTTDMFGWIEKSAVLAFKRWLNSPNHAAYVKRYSKKPVQVPATNDL